MYFFFFHFIFISMLLYLRSVSVFFLFDRWCKNVISIRFSFILFFVSFSLPLKLRNTLTFPFHKHHTGAVNFKAKNIGWCMCVFVSHLVAATRFTFNANIALYEWVKRERRRRSEDRIEKKQKKPLFSCFTFSYTKNWKKRRKIKPQEEGRKTNKLREIYWREEKRKKKRENEISIIRFTVVVAAVVFIKT